MSIFMSNSGLDFFFLIFFFYHEDIVFRFCSSCNASYD